MFQLELQIAILPYCHKENGIYCIVYGDTVVEVEMKLDGGVLAGNTSSNRIGPVLPLVVKK